MARRLSQLIRARWKVILPAVLVALAVGLNVMAYLHARALTHFTEGGPRTEKPENLSFGQKVSTLLLGANLPRPRNDMTPASVGLAYETVSFPSSDGLELEAWRIPREESKGLVLLFHGYAASKTQELASARFLHDQGYETFLVDFRGSGGSRGNETTLGVREADDVAAACERATGLSAHKEPILLGTSMGAVAVLRAVHARGVHPRAVILESPFGRMLDTVRARFAQMGVPSFPSAWLLVFWGGFQQGFDGFAHVPRDYARSVRCPALLLHGEEDPTVSVEQVREIFGALEGPKTLTLFPGVGHELLISARPDSWKAAVSAFLH